MTITPALVGQEQVGTCQAPDTESPHDFIFGGDEPGLSPRGAWGESGAKVHLRLHVGCGTAWPSGVGWILLAWF